MVGKMYYEHPTDAPASSCCVPEIDPREGHTMKVSTAAAGDAGMSREPLSPPRGRHRQQSERLIVYRSPCGFDVQDVSSSLHRT